MIAANLDLDQSVLPDTGGEGVVYSSLSATQGGWLFVAGLVIVLVVAVLAVRRLRDLNSSTGRAGRARLVAAVALLWSVSTTFQVTRTAISTNDGAEVWFVALTIVLGVGLGLLRTVPRSSLWLAGVAVTPPLVTALAAGVLSPNNGVLAVFFDVALFLVPAALGITLLAAASRALSGWSPRRGHASHA